MTEGQQISREVLPFLADLFPSGISSSVIAMIPSLCILSAAVIVVAGLVYLFIVSRSRLRTKKYLENFYLFGELEKIPEKKQQLYPLVRHCVVEGARIDLHTNRHDNSRVVSRIVYDICRMEKMSDLDCILYTCASMIYDAGFLDVNPTLFFSEVLFKKERELLRTHVMGGVYRMDYFAPEYKDLFLQAVMSHHENYDGSGYPEGMAGSMIPDVGLIIRVVETYVSLTTKRSYHKALAPKKALENMNKVKQFFCPRYFEDLKKIVLPSKNALM